MVWLKRQQLADDRCTALLRLMNTLLQLQQGTLGIPLLVRCVKPPCFSVYQQCFLLVWLQRLYLSVTPNVPLGIGQESSNRSGQAHVYRAQACTSTLRQAWSLSTNTLLHTGQHVTLRLTSLCKGKFGYHLKPVIVSSKLLSCAPGPSNAGQVKACVVWLVQMRGVCRHRKHPTPLSCCFIL